MRRIVQTTAGGGCAVIVGVLVTFWTIRGTQPSGHWAMPALYGALGAFVVVWVVATFGFRRSGKQRSGDSTSPEAALAEKCRAFGLDVKQFVAERRHGRPVFRAATEAENLRALGSLEATKARLMATAAFPADPVGDRRRGEIEDYDRETLRLFHERLGRAGAMLFDRAVEAGVAAAADEDSATAPESPEAVSEIAQRFRAYADGIAVAARRPRRQAFGTRRLARKMDKLLREGADALAGFPSRAPVAEASRSFRVDLAPHAEYQERAGKFDGRVRALLMSCRPSLLPVYAQEANAFLKRAQQARDARGPGEGASNAEKLKAFADEIHRGPALYLESCLAGLAAARNRLGH
jgi:hypothetical protein